LIGGVIVPRGGWRRRGGGRRRRRRGIIHHLISIAIFGDTEDGRRARRGRGIGKAEE